jgi:lipopolysaccharide export system protein LptA
MKPPVRIAHHRRRLLGTLLIIFFVTPAFAADEQACRVPVTTDPRLEELLKADPDDPHIDISSDSGDLARSGDAELSGNVQIRMGQRLLTADEAKVNADTSTRR